MAWSKRGKPWGKERESGEGASWLHEMTVSEGMEAVRQQWKEHGIHAEDGDWPLIQLAQISVLRGLTGRVAPLVVQLMERREADGKLRWNLEENLVGAVGISIVRVMAAYLEDPDIPVSRARKALDLFLRSIEPHDQIKPVRELMLLIAATRLDTDHSALRGKSKKLPTQVERERTGMCAAAHRQWRVEYLLSMGDEEGAIEFARKGREEKPCGETCALAPHSMYAWLLEPLHRRGFEEEAKRLHERLETLMVPRVLHLNAMGHRIHYLAVAGRFEEAGHLLRSMMPMAEDPEASPWQRLQFYEGCRRALKCARKSKHGREWLEGGEPSSGDLRTETDRAAAALTRRFRNRKK